MAEGCRMAVGMVGTVAEDVEVDVVKSVEAESDEDGVTTFFAPSDMPPFEVHGDSEINGG